MAPPAIVVAGELDELLEKSPALRNARACTCVLPTTCARGRHGRPVDKADVTGAFASFWLVVLTSVPAAIPFLLIDDARFALRVSNAILLALLFVAGYGWARFTTGRPWCL